MDGLVTAATAYVGAAPGLTFSYAPAEIQGAAEPAGPGIVGGRVHHVHPAQQHVVAGQHGVGLPVVGSPQMISMTSARPMQVPHSVNPYETIDAIIQREQHSHQAHHPHPHPAHTQQQQHPPHTHQHAQPPQQHSSQPQPQRTPQPPPSAIRLPSTSEPPLKLERPRVKGRMTPYAFFVQERRDYYRQQGVPVQFTAFSKECSQIWKTMNDDDKLKFQKLAEEDRERYRKEIAGFDKPLAKDGTRRGRRKKEPGQPKRNMCAFLHFCVVKRPKLKQENPSLSVGAMAKQLSSAWKLMTTDQKKPYDDMADRDKQRYEQQKQAYDAGYSAGYLRQDISPTSIQVGSTPGPVTPGGSGAVPSVPPILSPRHRRRKKNPDMPRRNMSAFMFYSLENRPDVKAANPDFGVGKLAKALAGTWGVITPVQKQPYETMAQKDKDRYESELKSFKKGMYTGSTLSARDIVLSVTGKTVPPPSQSRQHSSHVNTHPHLVVALNEHAGAGVAVTHSDNEQSPPSGDELDQLCEYYQ